MNLKEVVRWAAKRDWTKVEPLEFTYDGGVLLEVLWREKEFQVERVTVRPNRTIPEHRHPNVDSWELHVYGSGDAYVGRRKYKLGTWLLRQPAMKIPRNTWHGGTGGDGGNRWLSVQQWHGREPTTLALDWEGRSEKTEEETETENREATRP